MRILWPAVPVWLVAVALAVMAFVVMSSGAPSAQADNGPHIKGWGATADGCAACHRAHRGQAEPNLVQDQASLCASCHGPAAAGSSLDVIDGTNKSDGGALRGGGFTNARINTADPSLPPSSAIGVLAAPGLPAGSTHSVSGTPQTIWGYGAINAVADPGKSSFNLACGKCHDPHGDGNYRVLRKVPAGLLSYGAPLPAFMPDMTGLLTDESPKVYSTTNYWDVSYTDQWQAAIQSPPGPVADTEITGRQVGKWCTTCHTRYWASTGSADASSGDAIFKFRHTTNPAGRDTHGRAGPVTLSGSCLKCHAAHGSNATAATGVGMYSGSVEQPDGSHTGNGSGDSRLLRMDNRGICQKCHNK